MKPIAWMYTTACGTHFTDDENEWRDGVGVEEVTPLYAKPVPSIILVKDLCIANGSDYSRVWIGETVGGEGGDFDKEKFSEVVRAFYKDNF